MKKIISLFFLILNFYTPSFATILHLSGTEYDTYKYNIVSGKGIYTLNTKVFFDEKTKTIIWDYQKNEIKPSKINCFNQQHIEFIIEKDTPESFQKLLVNIDRVTGNFCTLRELYIKPYKLTSYYRCNGNCSIIDNKTKF